MKVKQYIYHWLFFPLLVLLLASGTTGCSNESVMEEEKTSGKTTLSITVRGVTQEPEKDGYDEYIKTLRLIVFDASGLVCNEFYNQEAISKWTVMDDGANTYYDITQELQNFSGGNCRFYFIANEEGYTVYGDDNTSLTDLLSKDGLKEDELKECMMASTPDNQDWSNKPILMIANPSAQYIRPGDNIEITDVELVRCVAKVQLIVQKDNTTENKIPEGDKVTISDVSLHGTRPESYTLWENGTVINGSDYSKTLLKETDESHEVGYPDSPYSSDIVYFPEKLYQDTTTEGDLYFTFTLNYTPNGDNTPTVRTYTVAIGKDDNKDGVVEDYNIYRNTFYTVTATLQWQPTEPTMNIQVDAWDEKTMDVPAFE